MKSLEDIDDNFYSQSRTNHFKVKNAEAFKADMARHKGVRVEEHVINGDQQVFALFSEGTEGMHSNYTDESTGELIISGWKQNIGKHLEDDWVCVYIEIHHSPNNLRVTGHAIAFNNKLEEEAVGLDNIFQLAGNLGGNFTSFAS